MAYSLQYYDLVLAGIIVAIGRSGLIGTFTWIQMPSAIPGLGAVSIGLIGPAMFVNGPIADVDDIAELVEEGPVPLEKLPLVV
ncbi:hypothetical protein BRC85_01635 [Halobacteriales archaeon QS_1_69_70]|nr:MAG: hypothetical protein BRC85_01635 [Halobacteriales archaeon QS_1_69_70]